MKVHIGRTVLQPCSRRVFMGRFAVASAGAAIFSGRTLAQAANPKRIDFHHHFGSPEWIKAITAKEGHTPKGFTPWLASASWKDFSPTHTIEAMDQGGTATAMLSCTTPGIWY